MIQFFQYNTGAVLSLLVMSIFWIVFNFRSVRGNIKAIDKARVDNGMIPMSDEEIKISVKVLRTSDATDSIGPLVAGIVALVVTHIII